MIEKQIIEDFVKLSNKIVDLQQENKILKKALELTCIKLLKPELREYKETVLKVINDFIEQAKESIDAKN